jgi:hypothetical protein
MDDVFVPNADSLIIGYTFFPWSMIKRNK